MGVWVCVQSTCELVCVLVCVHVCAHACLEENKSVCVLQCLHEGMCVATLKRSTSVADITVQVCFEQPINLNITTTSIKSSWTESQYKGPGLTVDAIILYWVLSFV